MTGSIFATVSIMFFAFGLNALTGMASRITPFVSIVVLGDVILLFALTGMLKAGTLFAFALSAALFALAIYRHKYEITEKIKGFLSPSVILFFVSCAIMLLILSVTQPVFHDWDEFSFWGTARKILNKFDALYTYHNTSMLGQSIPPSMPVLGYFFGFFNTVFTEWVCYYAYDVLFIASFAALCGICEKNNSCLPVFMFISGITMPFVFEITDISSKLSNAYISAYGDMPMAFVFAGAVAVYLRGERNNMWNIIPVLPALMFLTLIKDMGFALSCIVVFIVFFDMMADKKNFGFGALKGFFAKCAAAAVLLIVTVTSYIGWSIHLANVLNINRSEFSETASVSMAGMLISGIKELISPTKSRKFGAIYSSMLSAFSGIKVSMLGSGFRVVLVITAIFAVGFVLRNNRHKIKIAIMYLTSLTGFIGYYVFHLFLYVYVFKDDAYTLPSYGRYMNIYYAGWLCIAIMCLALSARTGKKMLCNGAMCTVAAGLMLLVIFYTDSGNLFFGADSTAYAKRTLIHKKVNYISDVIGPDDVIYIISEDNAGENWFIYSYELLDNYIVKDNILLGADSPPEQDRDIVKEISRYMKKNGATHLLVDNINHIVGRRYDYLFNRPIGDIAFDRVGYYKIIYTDTGFNFELVKWGRTG